MGRLGAEPVRLGRTFDDGGSGDDEDEDEYKEGEEKEEEGVGTQGMYPGGGDASVIVHR